MDWEEITNVDLNREFYNIIREHLKEKFLELDQYFDFVRIECREDQYGATKIKTKKSKDTLVFNPWAIFHPTAKQNKVKLISSLIDEAIEGEKIGMFKSPWGPTESWYRTYWYLKPFYIFLKWVYSWNFGKK